MLVQVETCWTCHRMTVATQLIYFRICFTYTPICLLKKGHMHSHLLHVQRVYENGSNYLPQSVCSHDIQSSVQLWRIILKTPASYGRTFCVTQSVPSSRRKRLLDNFSQTQFITCLNVTSVSVSTIDFS